MTIAKSVKSSKILVQTKKGAIDIAPVDHYDLKRKNEEGPQSFIMQSLLLNCQLLSKKPAIFISPVPFFNISNRKTIKSGKPLPPAKY